MQRFTTPTFVCVFILSGCGGSSDTGDTGDTGVDQRVTNPTEGLSGPYQYYAYFDLISDDLEGRVNYDANFLKMEETQPASVFALSVPPDIDKCNLRVTESIPTDASVIGFPEAMFTLVSAGDTFTLTDNTGTYASIVRADSRFEVAPYPIPEPLTLSIPGAGFPALSDVDVPNTPAVTNLTPSGANAELLADTTITWTPSGVAGHSVFIRVFDLPASDRVVDLRCRMADDGMFKLSDNSDVVDTLDETLGTGFVLTGVELERRAFNVVSQGDTLLVVGKQHESL